MDAWTPCDEFYSVAQKYATSLGNEANPFHPDLRLPLVFRTTGDEPIPAVLDQAQLKLIHAMMRCERPMEFVSLRAFTIGGSSCAASAATPRLPLEILQHIIACAYRSEELEKSSSMRCQIDFRDATDGRGAMGFAAHFRPGSSVERSLFLTTTITVIADWPQKYRGKLLPLKHAPHARYRVVIPQRPMFAWAEGEQKKNDIVEFLRQRASEVKSLQIESREFLESCMAFLPAMEHFSYLYSNGELGLNGAWLREESEKWRRNNIRSATLASPFLESFVSPGILKNITHLTIAFGMDLYTEVKWPTLHQILLILPEFPKLVSLELKHEYYFNEMEDSSSPTEFEIRNVQEYYDCPIDATPELRSLRRLALSCEGPLAVRAVFCFCRCDLEELALNRYGYDRRGHKDVEEICRKISDMFPRLEVLRLATMRIRKVLLRDAVSVDSGGVWNFPNLHTLDIRGASAPSVLEEMTDIPAVLYERLLRHRSTASASAEDSIVNAGPSPVNTLYMSSPPFYSITRNLKAKGRKYIGKDDLLRCQRLLVCLALERIVPNFIREQDSRY